MSVNKSAGKGPGQDIPSSEAAEEQQQTRHVEAHERELFLSVVAGTRPIMDGNKGQETDGIELRPIDANERRLFFETVVGERTVESGPQMRGAARTTTVTEVPGTAGRSASRQLEPLSPGGGLDRRARDRLRRGRIRPEMTLDLHGYTTTDAHIRLSRFLEEMQDTGKRCVLVVTGKGVRSNGGGVLRRELPKWLNAPVNRPRILAFAEAIPADGGSGAYYVMLRRRRL